MILIFPWARKTTDGKLSPKDYPYWPEVVRLFASKDIKTHQVSCAGEAGISCDTRSDDLSLAKIQAALKECESWISVDSFVPHMAWSIGEPGVAIFGLSDPWIFGHPDNINLLKDRKFLRKRQFGLWSQETPNPKAFISPDIVVTAAKMSIEKRKARKS